ncbi:hypothetical protein FSARC_11011 [Fusarium sarcochroum]|uniref:2EXR domain-containing protein n=1 Tax=Fusarium sarcochroum TaxID=1208366 RepID=A0A8H4TIA3_9HYPO|nr:hypothetical protein FSARC_11011 [Fusarium sarcochroum]
MAPSTFHLFSSLPCELRLLIWEQAIRPSKGKHGLHYFSISATRDLPDTKNNSVLLLGPYRPLRPFVASVPARTDSPNPRSAYLWDAGVWTACKESRAVIMKHFQIDHWTSQRGDIEPCDPHGHPSDLKSYKFHCETYSGYPVTTTIQENDNWQLVARLFDDMFCFRSNDWKAFTLAWRRCGTGFWLRSLTVKHIALEFDRSWNVDVTEWTSSPDVYSYKTSPRSFIVELIRDVARFDMHFQIWLIDLDSQWRAEHAELGQRDTFYDCQQEFVEVHSSYRDNTKRLGEDATALDFIWHLAKFDDEFSEIYMPGYTIQVPRSGDDWFYAHRFIKVLAPKENFIQL